MLKHKVKGRSKRQRARRKETKYGESLVAYTGFQQRLTPMIRRKKNQIRQQERDIKIEARRALKLAQAENAKLIAIANENSQP